MKSSQIEYVYYILKGGKKVDKDFVYTSDSNKEWMEVNQLRDWIKKNKEKIGKI